MWSGLYELEVADGPSQKDGRVGAMAGKAGGVAEVADIEFSDDTGLGMEIEVSVLEESAANSEVKAGQTK